MRPARSSGQPSGSTRSSPTSTTGTPTGGSRSTPGRLTLLPDAVPADGSPAGTAATTGDRRAVEVAVDAAGRGGDRTYTYLVPDALADVELGEAVLVEFGRRQALGI